MLTFDADIVSNVVKTACVTFSVMVHGRLERLSSLS